MSRSSRPRTTRRHRSAALLAAAALLLTGCGSARPGTAVSIGGEEISVAQADRAAEALCLGAVQSSQEQGQEMQPISMGTARRAAVNILAVEQVIRDLMDEYDVQPGEAYTTTRAEAAAQAERLPERLREDYVDVMTVQDLLDSVALELGAAALREEGVRDPAEEEAGARVNQLLAESWPDADELDLDPRFGLALGEAGGLVPADTSLSVPVSEAAVAGAAEQPDPAYAGSLPAAQRCG